MASSMTKNTEGGASAGSGRTTIFKGIRFWLARRLLDRYDLANKIKSSDGIVVALEKDADMLIADPARKDSPQGSYSYMFIIDSVNNGFIQIQDKYRIGPDPDLQRPGRNLAKPFRVAFTAEDDAVLAKWALEHPRSLRGNDTWKQLEEMNQRHTFQSWRDRYLKRYCDFTPAQLKTLAAGASKTALTPESHVPQRSKGREAGSRLSRAVGRDAEQQEETEVPSSADKSSSVLRPQHHEVTPKKVPQEPKGSAEAEIVESSGDQPDVVEEDAASNADSVTEKERFYYDLQLFVDEMEKDVDWQCNIGGRFFELWDLYEATDSQNLPFLELDWVKVAADLGYEQTQRAKVAKSLLRCYENNLREFCDGVVSFGEETEDKEKVLGSGQIEPQGGSGASAPVVGAGQPSSIYDVPPSPSPPSEATTHTKRPLSTSWHSPKRMRLDQNAEIPSTPGMDRSPFRSRLIQGMESPSLRKSLAQRSLFPSKNGKANPEQSSSSMRRDIPEKNMASSTIDDPFMSSPVTQGRVPSRRQGSEEMAICGSWADYEEATVMTTSPSTVKALPKVMKRTLPSSFQPPTSSSLPNPRPPQPFAQSKKDRSGSGGRPRNNEEERGISWWMKHYESLGYSRETIREAMFKTSMVPGKKVEVVLKSLKDGEGVPKNHEGIWTEKDDKYLKFVDSVLTNRKEDSYTEAELPNKRKAEEMLKRLEYKHSPDLVEHRRRFLEAEATVNGGRR